MTSWALLGAGAVGVGAVGWREYVASLGIVAASVTSDGDAVSAETVDGVSLPSVGASATSVLTEGESVTEFTSAVTASVAAGCEMTDCSFASTTGSALASCTMDIEDCLCSL